MTKKLEELFNLPPTDDDDDLEESIEETREQLVAIDETIDKIDAALPMVRDLEASDSEMDELAHKATKTFDDLMDLGMQVDSRFASEIFAVAGTMLGHALTAKTAKLNKKLKMIDLQLKKARLDQTPATGNAGPVSNGQATVLDRNELLARVLGTNSQNVKKE